MITISNLTVRFGGVTALDCVNVSLADDVVGIIGPNGAGKTTLINVLSGFVEPAAGMVEADGQDLLLLPPHRRARWGLSRSFQKARTAPDLTVGEQVRVALDHRSGTAADRDRTVRLALDYVGLGEVEHTRGCELNACEQRLLEIARCVASSPRIVLLDEPGGGIGDAEGESIRSIIAGIPPTFGAQVLLIDHDVELIKALCSSTMVLDFGKLIAFGPTDLVLRDDNVRAAYLGSTGR